MSPRRIKATARLHVALERQAAANVEVHAAFEELALAAAQEDGGPTLARTNLAITDIDRARARRSLEGRR